MAGLPSGLKVLAMALKFPLLTVLSNLWSPDTFMLPALLVLPKVENCPPLWSSTLTVPSLALLKFLKAWVPWIEATPPAWLAKLLNSARSIRIAAGLPSGLKVLAMAWKFPLLVVLSNLWSPDTCMLPAFMVSPTVENCPPLWSRNLTLPSLALLKLAMS